MSNVVADVPSVTCAPEAECSNLTPILIGLTVAASLQYSGNFKRIVLNSHGRHVHVNTGDLHNESLGHRSLANAVSPNNIILQYIFEQKLSYLSSLWFWNQAVFFILFDTLYIE